MEPGLWDLFLEMFGFNPEPTTLPTNEIGVVWIPGG